MPRGHTVLVLAGSRTGGRDPLLGQTQFEHKALLPIGGQPMLAYVLQTLDDWAGCDRIVVSAQNPEVLQGIVDSIAFRKACVLRESKSTIAQTIDDYLNEFDGPVIVTTSDSTLLSSTMLEQFARKSDGSDLAVGIVSREVFQSSGFEAKRTWYEFRSSAYSGTNLFHLSGNAVRPIVGRWSKIEQSRKKKWRIATVFGPKILLGAALRLLTVHGFANALSARFSIKVRAVELDYAEACIDADNLADVELIEKLLLSRSAI